MAEFETVLLDWENPGYGDVAVFSDAKMVHTGFDQYCHIVRLKILCTGFRANRRCNPIPDVAEVPAAPAIAHLHCHSVDGRVDCQCLVTLPPHLMPDVAEVTSSSPCRCPSSVDGRTLTVNC